MNFIDTDLLRKRAPREIRASARAACASDESKINVHAGGPHRAPVYERRLGRRKKTQRWTGGLHLHPGLVPLSEKSGLMTTNNIHVFYGSLHFFLRSPLDCNVTTLRHKTTITVMVVESVYEI